MGCYSKENDMISESVDSAIHEKLSKPLFYVSIWGHSKIQDQSINGIKEYQSNLLIT